MKRREDAMDGAENECLMLSQPVLHKTSRLLTFGETSSCLTLFVEVVCKLKVEPLSRK